MEKNNPGKGVGGGVVREGHIHSVSLELKEKGVRCMHISGCVWRGRNRVQAEMQRPFAGLCCSIFQPRPLTVINSEPFTVSQTFVLIVISSGPPPCSHQQGLQVPRRVPSDYIHYRGKIPLASRGGLTITLCGNLPADGTAQPLTEWVMPQPVA